MIHFAQSEAEALSLIQVYEDKNIDYEVIDLEFKDQFLRGYTKRETSRFNCFENRMDGGDLLRLYLRVIGAATKQFGANPHWWSTMALSKNRIFCRLSTDICYLIGILERLKSQANDHWALILIGPSSALRAGVRENAPAYGHQVVSKDQLSTSIMSFARRIGRVVSVATVELVQMLRRWVACKKQYRSRAIQKDKGLFVVKSFAYLSAFKDADYTDSYFGKIETELSKHLEDDIEVATVVFPFDNFESIFASISSLNTSWVIPFDSLIDLSDIFLGYFSILWGGIFNRLRIREDVVEGGIHWRDMVNADLDTGGDYRPLPQVLHYSAARCLTSRYSVRASLMTYEGNPWERMWIKGLRDGDCGEVIGYQHSAVTQGSGGHFLGPYEIDYLPIPDRFLTTGDPSASILTKYSAKGLAPEPACALRHDYLRNFDPQQSKKCDRITKILVAFEGLHEVVPLYLYVANQSLKCPDVEFRMRAHPALPFEVIEKLANFPMAIFPDNVVFSTGASLQDDLRAVDLIVYWGTTVAVEAIAMGKPLIHYSRGDFISFDPLFELDDFKWTITNGGSLRDTIRHIESMPIDQYLDQQAKAANYARDYFRPVEDVHIRKFLPSRRIAEAS